MKARDLASEMCAAFEALSSRCAERLVDPWGVPRY